MGQAFDQGGNVIAEVFGQTKKEVFDKLAELAPTAAEIRIRTLMQQLQQKENPMDEQEDIGRPGPQFIGRDHKDKIISIKRRRELMAMAEEASDWIIAKNIKPEELCFFKQAVEMLTDTRR